MLTVESDYSGHVLAITLNIHKSDKLAECVWKWQQN